MNLFQNGAQATYLLNLYFVVRAQIHLSGVAFWKKENPAPPYYLYR